MSALGTHLQILGPVLLAASLLLTAHTAYAQPDYVVTVVVKTAAHPHFGQGDPEGYALNGTEGLEITLERGQSYTFQMSNVPAHHPFYISTSASGAGTATWSDGVTGNFAIGNATLTFDVPAHAPDELWYQCAAHLYMGYRINIVDGQQSDSFAAVLSGGQEIPANASTASGALALNLTGNSLEVSGAFTGLSSPYTASHLHLGYAGQNGPVVVTLTADLSGDSRSGTYSAAENTFELTSEQASAVAERRTYVNVHSEAIPAGEIRGQVTPANTPTFNAVLTGRAEHPANASQAVGAVVGELSGTTQIMLTLTGSFSDLESDYHKDIGSHIHIGALHENGPVVFDLQPSLDSGLRSGTFSAAQNAFELLGPNLEDLTSGNFYVNVHTQNHPPGEIRGQLMLMGSHAFEVKMTGEHETPPIETSSTGGAIAILTNNDLRLGGSFAGLTSPYTAAHIHIGEVGVSGGVVFNLIADLDSDDLGGVFDVADNTFTLTPEQRADLFAGSYYINVHSVNHPPGEIRGQMVVATNLAPSPPAITSPEDGASIVIAGHPDETLTVSWSAADPNANPMFFEWQLAASPTFGVVLADVTTHDQEMSLTYGEIDDLLADAGVPQGGSVTLHHRVLASDGGFIEAGASASATLTRGVVSSDEPGAETVAFGVVGPSPNPFTTSAMVLLDLPQQAQVGVTLYDVLGRQVYHEPLGMLAPGRSLPVVLSGNGLAAGVYLYSIEAWTDSEVWRATGRITLLP